MNPVDESRYSRQIKLPQIGIEGQRKISHARVLVVGMGGLGSPAVMYLAAAGVGHFVLSDFDVVEESNLQRQVIHGTDNIGELKTASAKKAIQRLNPACEVTTIDFALEGDALLAEVKAADIVLDCSDNFPTRFAVNRCCVETATALVSAAAIRMSGQIMSYIPDAGGPCYQCVYSEEFENAFTCESEGVLGPVVGVMGTMQALQALLLLVGKTDSINGQLMLFDGYNMMWQQVKIPRKPSCPVCGQ